MALVDELAAGVGPVNGDAIGAGLAGQSDWIEIRRTAQSDGRRDVGVQLANLPDRGVIVRKEQYVSSQVVPLDQFEYASWKIWIGRTAQRCIRSLQLDGQWHSLFFGPREHVLEYWHPLARKGVGIPGPGAE